MACPGEVGWLYGRGEGQLFRAFDEVSEGPAWGSGPAAWWRAKSVFQLDLTKTNDTGRAHGNFDSRGGAVGGCWFPLGTTICARRSKTGCLGLYRLRRTFWSFVRMPARGFLAILGFLCGFRIAGSRYLLRRWGLALRRVRPAGLADGLAKETLWWLCRASTRAARALSDGARPSFFGQRPPCFRADCVILSARRGGRSSYEPCYESGFELRT